MWWRKYGDDADATNSELVLVIQEEKEMFAALPERPREGERRNNSGWYQTSPLALTHHLLYVPRVIHVPREVGR